MISSLYSRKKQTSEQQEIHVTAELTMTGKRASSALEHTLPFLAMRKSRKATVGQEILTKTFSVSFDRSRNLDKNPFMDI